MIHDQVLVPLVTWLRVRSQIALTYPTILYSSYSAAYPYYGSVTISNRFPNRNQYPNDSRFVKDNCQIKKIPLTLFHLQYLYLPIHFFTRKCFEFSPCKIYRAWRAPSHLVVNIGCTSNKGNLLLAELVTSILFQSINHPQHPQNVCKLFFNNNPRV